MCTAAMTGVDVKLMIPLHGDSRIVEWATRSYIEEIMEAGVKVYLYKSGFNHTKMMVSDDIISTCGSTNIDFRSFENNFEANVFFYQRDMALRMKELFYADMNNCIALTHNMRKRLAGNRGRRHALKSFLTHLWISLMRLLSPLL